MIDATILLQAVMESRDGVTISDPNKPDNPLIFVNPAFEKMTGYSKNEILNRNCRFLQGEHRKPRQWEVVQDAIREGKNCLVTLQNYRKDGSMFWNELSISPVRDTSGKLTHFIGIQKDVTARVLLEQLIEKDRKSLQESNAILEDLVIQDEITGIFNRRYFETELKKTWEHLKSSQRSLTLMLLDIDHFKIYNDKYGHTAGDTALKRVASTLTDSMKRATDFTSRYGGEEFAVLSIGMTKEEAITYGKILCSNINKLNIPHETTSAGVLTISCGIAHLDSVSFTTQDLLILHADTALYEAKARGRNQAALFNAK